MYTELIFRSIFIFSLAEGAKELHEKYENIFFYEKIIKFFIYISILVHLLWKKCSNKLKEWEIERN